LKGLKLFLLERINRLEEIAGKMPQSIELNIKTGNDKLPYLQQQKDFYISLAQNEG